MNRPAPLYRALTSGQLESSFLPSWQNLQWLPEMAAKAYLILRYGLAIISIFWHIPCYEDRTRVSPSFETATMKPRVSKTRRGVPDRKSQ